MPNKCFNLIGEKVSITGDANNAGDTAKHYIGIVSM